jgi:tRNA threonylcarbamoyladenosine biosynthesis protein TsaE
MTTPVDLATESPEQTQEMASAFADACRPNDVIGLQGTLGAGKTCFVKGLARGLGIKESVVSPTFVLLRRYEGRLALHHFDAYRLRGAGDMEGIGCTETFESGGVSVVEWADHVAACLPPEHFLLTFRVTGERRREFTLSAHGEHCLGRMDGFRRALAPWAR